MGNSGPLSFLRSIYDLDTLDTRFTTSSSTPYRAVIDARNEKKEVPKPQPVPGAEPSKWKKPEFFVYYTLLSFIIPYMFWVAYDVSRPSHPKYYKFEPLLWPGWIPGRKITNYLTQTSTLRQDVSDSQYRVFRWNLPYMFALLTFHPLLRRVWNLVIYPVPASLTPPSSRSSSPKNAASRFPGSAATAEEVGAARLKQRVSFDFTWAILFLFILHGFSALKVLFILLMNYQLCMNLPRKHIPVATWIFNIGILFANELCTGYPFEGMARLISPGGETGIISAEDSFLVSLGKWLDEHGGIMPRWQILFNITILRLVSFNMDYYWSLDSRAGSPVEKKQLDPASLSERDRVSIPALPHEFTYRHYIAHAIYAPLYLAGPILTFNDYIAQCKHRPLTIETRRTFLYGVRFLLTLLAMEFILHYNYVIAISKADPNWGDYTAPQLSLLSYFNLHIIWLKLLLPFRMFRLWALVDGIDPPENMIRCVSDNYSTLMFWRSWHRSYNRWLLRYIYIPLGGANFRSWRQIVRSLITYILVFTFVALWHDIQLRLLIWGWMIVFFFLPEIATGYFFPKHKWQGREKTYRALASIGGVANVFMMMTANLVGFAVGLDGLQSIIRGIMADYYGWFFLFMASCSFLITIQIMFELRQHEKRRGIDLKC
ncbi:uncharacterized protein MKZ38_009331 [Zalerion maritima]|uniref:Glycerol uptake protein 1 n=1 Tax=Zalerion maritima TaxID=339359 RepID=A0AAD5RK61_9PEZI|nr:uncharacterized protein MKZ38_009331 [Zalerion maritima]